MYPLGSTGNGYKKKSSKSTSFIFSTAIVAAIVLLVIQLLNLQVFHFPVLIWVITQVSAYWIVGMIAGRAHVAYERKLPRNKGLIHGKNLHAERPGAITGIITSLLFWFALGMIGMILGLTGQWLSPIAGSYLICLGPGDFISSLLLGGLGGWAVNTTIR